DTDPEAHGIFIRSKGFNHAGSIHVSLDKVTTEAIAGGQSPLQIDRGSDLQLPQIGPVHRFRHHVCGKGAVAEGNYRETHSVDGNAVADPDILQHPAAGDLQHHRRPAALDAFDAPHFLYNSCKHAPASRLSGYTGYSTMQTLFRGKEPPWPMAPSKGGRDRPNKERPPSGPMSS